MKPSGNKSKVRLDVNNPIFLEGLFELDKNDRHAVLNTLMKISKLTWDQVYLDKGLHWHLLFERNYYSIAINQDFVAFAGRDGVLEVLRYKF